jgi:HSP20 family protein
MNKVLIGSFFSVVTTTSLFSFGGLDNDHLNDLNKRFSHFASFFDHRINYPAVNIYERENDYLIEVEIAGMGKNEIEVSISDNQIISISGEKLENNSSANFKALREERFFGKFQREILLPNNIDSSKIDVKNENGVLKIIVSKDIKKTGKRVIQIN